METMMYVILILVLLIVCLMTWLVVFIITKNKITNNIINEIKEDIYEVNGRSAETSAVVNNEYAIIKGKLDDIEKISENLNNGMYADRKETFKKVTEINDILKEHNKEKAALLNLDNSLNKQTSTIINNLAAQIGDLLRTLEIIKTNTTPKPKTTRTRTKSSKAKISSKDSDLNNCTKSENNSLKQPKTAEKLKSDAHTKFNDLKYDKNIDEHKCNKNIDDIIEDL